MSHPYNLRSRSSNNQSLLTQRSLISDEELQNKIHSPLSKRARISTKKNSRSDTAKSTPQRICRDEKTSRPNQRLIPLFREKAYKQILDYVQARNKDNKPGCLYIHGVPGTGKTATVKSLLDNLSSQDEFNCIYINAMRLANPIKAYGKIANDLLGIRKADRNALQYLYNYFSSAEHRKPCLLILDELDYLYNRTQSVFYNLFDWANLPNCKFILIAIANTMDMPDRVMNNKVKSRMGFERLCFPPYTSQQIAEIIEHNLQETRMFNTETVLFASKKVAGVCGDLRRAMSICKMAVEIAQQSNCKHVKLEHIAEAIDEIFSCPLMKGLNSLSTNDRSILKIICMEVKRLRGTGRELTVGDILDISNNERLAMIAIRRLESTGLLYGEPADGGKSANRLMRSLKTKIPVEDVLKALSVQ
ncbi:hypothetical protein ACOME3_009497 [Neoechinorhynchus agilis]